MWKWIVSGILALLGVGGTAYGVDQHLKRKHEQAAHRAELGRMEARLREVEVRFGRQSEQFRLLALEVERLRRSAAA
jgi:hypothetical protein